MFPISYKTVTKLAVYKIRAMRTETNRETNRKGVIKMAKTLTFKKATDAMGMGLLIAMLEKNDINYDIEETPTTWSIYITGHKS